MVPSVVQGDEGYPNSRVWGWAQDVACRCWRMVSSRERSPAWLQSSH